MKTPQLIKTPLPAAGWSLRHAKLNLLKHYAAWRVGATPTEKRAHHTADTILLTFDDYGTHAQVNRLLITLRQYNVRAMFFLQGNWAQEQPKLVANIAAGGHIIGNHTYSHADLTQLSDRELKRELTSGPASSWLRPPCGRYNAHVRAIAQTLGLRICYWTIDSDDWQGVSPYYIKRKVLAELHPGAVLLFHLHADATATILPELIQAIRARGFELDSPGHPRWETAS